MSKHPTECDPHEHEHGTPVPVPDEAACRVAAEIFRVLGDAARLQLLAIIMPGEMCVSEIAQRLGDSLPAVSQRLKLLRAQRIVAHRRAGKHVYYRLEDDHIAKLISNALAHASE